MPEDIEDASVETAPHPVESCRPKMCEFEAVRAAARLALASAFRDEVLARNLIPFVSAAHTTISACLDSTTPRWPSFVLSSGGSQRSPSAL